MYRASYLVVTQYSRGELSSYMENMLELNTFSAKRPYLMIMFDLVIEL